MAYSLSPDVQKPVEFQWVLTLEQMWRCSSSSTPVEVPLHNPHPLAWHQRILSEAHFKHALINYILLQVIKKDHKEGVDYLSSHFMRQSMQHSIRRGIQKFPPPPNHKAIVGPSQAIYGYIWRQRASIQTGQFSATIQRKDLTLHLTQN